jgi:hypothetical protein
LQLRHGSAAFWPLVADFVGAWIENHDMAWAVQRREPSTFDGWVALGWSFAVLVGAGILGTLALPGTVPHAYDEFSRGDFLRPEWLVLATLLAYPVYLASRANWFVAVPVVAIVSAQSWYVVDTALESMHQAGVAGSSDVVWYALVVGQIAVFVVAGSVGLWRCLSRRRWTRQMRRLVPELAHIRVVSGEESPAWP